MQAGQSRGPWLWPLVLVLIGVILLLDNFLLLDDFDPTLLWPLVLVLIGAQVLLQGDFLPGNHSKTFGITRGSVEAALLEINAGEVDVQLRSLQREGRLIAGQFAAQSRPVMAAADANAHLRLDRAATPWFSFANWEMGLARDLPWQIYISTHLGQVQLDMSSTIVENLVVGTGFGDIRLICPYECLGTIHLQSALGSIQLVTPHGYHVTVIAPQGRFFGVHVDPERYEEIEPGVYHAHDPDPTAPQFEVHIGGTFGDAYLA